MTLYVDELRQTTPSQRWPYHWSCHLTADSHGELLEAAGRLRLSRSWLQAAGRWHEHFDLTAAKRDEAVRRLGAVETTARERVKQLRPDLFPPERAVPT
jgi:hypothetical protein